MKHPVIFFTSLALNLVLAGVWIAMRRPTSPTPQADETPASTVSFPNVTSEIATSSVISSPAILLTKFKWNLIESDDYHQYVANLRAVECPEWLIQDILLADIQGHYRKTFSSLSDTRENLQPWHGHDRRQAHRRERMDQFKAVGEQQKRLIKELLGIEWTDKENWLDGYEEEMVWFGFMDRKKATGLLAVLENAQEASSQVQQQANGILIDEDHVRLNQIKETMQSQLQSLLTPAEFEELELRAQWEDKINNGDVHLDGMTLTGVELRALAHASLMLGRTLEDGFIGGKPNDSEAEQEARETQFVAELKKVLGPTRMAEYERAQDQQFREAFEFTSAQHLPVNTATRISSAVKNASEQAEQIKADETLTREQQAEALATLKTSTAKALASVLGSKLDDYLAGKNELFNSMLELPEIESRTQQSPGVIR